VEDGVTGFLVPPRNSGALGAQMLALFDQNDAGRAAISAASTLRIRQIFDEKIVLNAYISITQRVLSKKALGLHQRG
jgi:hypothetical protein